MKREKKNSGLLATLFGTLVIVGIVIIYHYHRFRTVSTYPDLFGNYTIEEGYRLKEGDWHFNRLFRIKDQQNDSLVIKEKNWGDGHIQQIVWFEDSVYVQYSGTEFELYRLYDLQTGKESKLDSLHFAKNLSKGVLIDPK